MRKILLLPTLAALCALLALSSCARKDPGQAGGTDVPSASDSGTGDGTGTGPAGEDATAIPRYDYMEADVAPDVEIEPSDYAEIRLTLPAYLKVGDKDVQDYLRFIRMEHRTPDHGTDIMRDRPMKEGDSAFLYYRGLLDGEEFDGGSNWDDQQPFELVLGSGQFIPGFEEKLIGVKPGDTSRERPAEVSLTFPKDYHHKDMAGKDVVFHVFVDYAVEYTVPALDRAFIEETLKYEPQKSFYASDRALIEEFEGFVRGKLEKDAGEETEKVKTDLLWTHMTEKIHCRNLPPAEVEFYVKSYRGRMESDYERYRATGGEDFARRYPTLDAFAPAYLNLEKGADWQAEFRTHAEQMVRRTMILHAIAEIEGIETVTDEEYQKAVRYWADAYQGYMTEEEVVRNVGEVFLRETAFSEKMERWLLDRCVFTFEGEEGA